MGTQNLRARQGKLMHHVSALCYLVKCESRGVLFNTPETVAPGEMSSVWDDRTRPIARKKRSTARVQCDRH